MLFCQRCSGGNVNIVADWKTSHILYPGAEDLNKLHRIVINYRKDIFRKSQLHIYLAYPIQHINSHYFGLRGGGKKDREINYQEGKKRQELNWQFADKPQDEVWKSMSSQWTILKSNSSHNQLHRSSICQFGNCFCMVSAAAGLSHHWFSIKDKHHIIIYWIEQIPPNAEYI